MAILRQQLFKDTIPFTRWRFWGFAVSLVLVVGSLVLLATRGLNLGIDFQGGLLLEISTPGPADLGKIRSTLGGQGLGEVQVQTFGEAENVLIRIETQPGGEAAQQAALARVEESLRAAVGDGMTIRRTEVVGPKVGRELVEKGVIAMILALGMMLVYIWFRFEWQFSLGAVAALAHDVITTIGFFSLLQLDFTLSIVAAVLTIIGYSINDTVVIYDRIRENLRKYKKMELTELIDRSMTETLSRTIMTATTVFLALVALVIFGGEVIRGFALAMLWGVIEGTYSTIFVACPILLYTGVKRDWSGDAPKTAGNKAGAAS